MQILQTKTVGIEKAEIPPDAIKNFEHAAERFSEADLIRLMQYCTAAEVDIRRKYNPRTRLQLLLLKFATMSSSISLTDLLRRFESGTLTDQSAPRTKPADESIQRLTSVETEKKKKPEPYQTKLLNNNLNKADKSQVGKPRKIESVQEDKAASDVSSQSDDPLVAAQKTWTKVCDKVAAAYNSSGQLIKFGGYPVSYEDGGLTIRFSSKIHSDAAQSCMTALHRELKSIIGDVKLELEVGELPGNIESEKTEESDPALKLLFDRLGAKLED